jgi:cation diffusion facilitator CzcD-associated flavoprotein CzcO
VLLERGDIANSWRHERWDSLRLLTPSWQTRLPGFHYDGPDPDGYMTMGSGRVRPLRRVLERLSARTPPSPR